MTFAGKTALVTGASRGIGRAVSKALLAEGARVFGTSRQPDLVDWPAGVVPLTFDASSLDKVEAGWHEATERCERFDIVVNNAGAGVFGSFADTEFEEWNRQLVLALVGVMRISQLALRQWSLGQPGFLVNVSSLAVEYPIPYMSGYNAAKAGVAAFCESLILETDARVAKIIEFRVGDVNTSFNASVRGESRGGRQGRVWAKMCEHVLSGPSPELVADTLLRGMRKDRQGILRSGSFFQSVAASLFARLVSQGFKRKANLSYYDIGEER